MPMTVTREKLIRRVRETVTEEFESLEDEARVTFYEEDLAITPHGMSLYRGVLVIWDGDHDERVLTLLDNMPPSVLRELLAIGESKGGVNLLWRTYIPEGYNETKDNVEAPDGDVWSIYSSNIAGWSQSESPWSQSESQ